MQRPRPSRPTRPMARPTRPGQSQSLMSSPTPHNRDLGMTSEQVARTQPNTPPKVPMRPARPEALSRTNSNPDMSRGRPPRPARPMTPSRQSSEHSRPMGRPRPMPQRPLHHSNSQSSLGSSISNASSRQVGATRPPMTGGSRPVRPPMNNIARPSMRQGMMPSNQQGSTPQHQDQQSSQQLPPPGPQQGDLQYGQPQPPMRPMLPGPQQGQPQQGQPQPVQGQFNPNSPPPGPPFPTGSQQQLPSPMNKLDPSQIPNPLDLEYKDRRDAYYASMDPFSDNAHPDRSHYPPMTFTDCLQIDKGNCIPNFIRPTGPVPLDLPFATYIEPFYTDTPLVLSLIHI